ncbi:MAG TPA: flavohemoglobin expression-modulating QEGLA motif protein [Kofleriaceae bacterium]|nr:flavohemoglobin expression-modulating QEGLA motif protein [Kofleriaceae bacterium]
MRSPGRADRIRQVAKLLRDAERPVRILRTVAWPARLRDEFFASGESALPRPQYEPLDPSATLALVAEARRLATADDDIDEWLRRQAWAIELGARMLAAVGTREFTALSIELYGEPSSFLNDQASTSLDLARAFEHTLSDANTMNLGPETEHTAEEIAQRVGKAVVRFFGPRAPEVHIVDELSANALAQTGDIKLRRGARFTDRDAAQLVQHEAFIHIATSLNGRDQIDLPILGAGHPGTTRTQEGLAVFAEFISGAIDPDRLGRLADRVLAIQMAQDGADFLDVYRWFLTQTAGNKDQAFENTRRVFRGGTLTGGAPFTKDVVYLDGLLRVHNFLRAAVLSGRSDCLRLLFAGKLEIEDVPALCHLSEIGLLRPPTFLPPWAHDLRFLVAYLAYSGFLNSVDLGKIRAHYDALLADAPPVHFD